MIVYKYVVPDRVDVLEGGHIRFTQPAALNDPFDVYPCFNEHKAALREKVRRQLEEWEPLFNPIQNTLGAMSLNLSVEQGVERIRQNLLQNYPLLCLTKKRSNLLMWAHYTDSHRGFVLGFDRGHPFFNRTPPRTMSPLLEVEYSNERFMVPALEELTEEKAWKILLLKSSHWSYEEELRMIAKPGAADLKLRKGGQNLYLYKFPPEALKEVILGQRMGKQTRRKIYELVKSRYPHAEAFEASLNSTMYDLEIVPLKL